MRISDWSSDVCSSDLRAGLHHRHHRRTDRRGDRPGIRRDDGADVPRLLRGGADRAGDRRAGRTWTAVPPHLTVISPHRAGTGMASAPFAIRVMAARRGRWRRTMGGYQVSGPGPGAGGYDAEDTEYSQRADNLGENGKDSGWK